MPKRRGGVGVAEAIWTVGMTHGRPRAAALPGTSATTTNAAIAGNHSRTRGMGRPMLPRSAGRPAALSFAGDSSAEVGSGALGARALERDQRARVLERDELAAQLVACREQLLDLVAQLLGAALERVDLGLGALELGLELEDALDAREVEAEVRGHLLD